MGFKATKIFALWPAAWVGGAEQECGIGYRTREVAGNHVELMLDCWMTPDGEYAVRLAELCRPLSP